MIFVNEINGSDAIHDTLCYPVISAIFQLRIRRLPVQVLPDAPSTHSMDRDFLRRDGTAFHGKLWWFACLRQFLLLPHAL
jgi:hypothetical protein